MPIYRDPSTVDYYGSVAQIAQEEDRVETDIHLVGWTKKLRIRALSFDQMERINRNAKIHVTDEKTNRVAGEIDHAEFVYHTLVEGVVIPRMNYAQAKMLADNNGEIIRELADQIWDLGRVTKAAWDLFIEEQQRLAAIEKTGNPDADIDTSET
jgi:hypothetical protein